MISASLSTNALVSQKHLCSCRNGPHRLCLSTVCVTFLCMCVNVEVSKQKSRWIWARTFFSVIELIGVCKNNTYRDSLPFKQCVTLAALYGIGCGGWGGGRIKEMGENGNGTEHTHLGGSTMESKTGTSRLLMNGNKDRKADLEVKRTSLRLEFSCRLVLTTRLSRTTSISK